MDCGLWKRFDAEKNALGPWTVFVLTSKIVVGGSTLSDKVKEYSYNFKSSVNENKSIERKF